MLCKLLHIFLHIIKKNLRNTLIKLPYSDIHSVHIMGAEWLYEATASVLTTAKCNGVW